MSRFATDFAAVARSQLNYVFGETANYTPVDGDQIEITVRVTRGFAVESDDAQDDRKTAREITVAVAQADVRVPGRGDVIELADGTFKVDTVNVESGGLFVANMKDESYVTAIEFTDIEFAERGTRQDARA